MFCNSCGYNKTDIELKNKFYFLQIIKHDRVYWMTKEKKIKEIFTMLSSNSTPIKAPRKVFSKDLPLEPDAIIENERNANLGNLI